MVKPCCHLDRVYYCASGSCRLANRIWLGVFLTANDSPEAIAYDSFIVLGYACSLTGDASLGLVGCCGMLYDDRLCSGIVTAGVWGAAYHGCLKG